MNNDKPLSKEGEWVGIAIVVLVVGWLWWVSTGEARPGAFHEKTDYSAKVYVNVFPDGDKSKNYKLPADMSKVSDDGGAAYNIEKVYWPNGGYFEFDDCEADMNSSTKVLKAYCSHTENPGEQSEEENWYTIEVTNQLVAQ
jgi:hypothetical protein